MGVAGTMEYLAPEVFSGEYGKECDVWSLGVMLFQLSSGECPFQGKNIQEMKSKILKETVKIPDHLSEELKDLLLKMLEKDPSKRITLVELLSHQWISKNEPKDQSCDSDILRT